MEQFIIDRICTVVQRDRGSSHHQPHAVTTFPLVTGEHGKNLFAHFAHLHFYCLMVDMWVDTTSYGALTMEEIAKFMDAMDEGIAAAQCICDKFLRPMVDGACAEKWTTRPLCHR